MVTLLTGTKILMPRSKDVDPSLLQVVTIGQAGFIEPFALLSRADNEIAQDYVSHRAGDRDQIFRHFDEFVVPKASPPAASQ
jgi:hypothetical protein